MKKFRFHFNTKYAIQLRDAVNDRQKQSIDNVHADNQIKGDYFAWDRTCAAMDRLEDTLGYINTLELGCDGGNRTAFDFYDFINNAYIIIDCIKTIGKIFRIDNQLIESIEKSSSVFGTKLSEKSTDGRYFEYVRSLCSVHPLCTNHQRAFLNGSQFHCCPFVVWQDHPYCLDRNGADLMAWIYPSKKGAERIYLGLYVSQFEEYVTKWIDLIPKIIDAKNNYTDNEYEKLRKEPVKSLSDFADNAVAYLAYLKIEYCKRVDYGSEHLFDEYIRVLTISLSDSRNNEVLDKYKQAIIYSLQFVRNELQNMSYEGYENNGIKYPEPWLETTLFDSLSSFGAYDSAFSKYAYNLEKIYYLEPDYYDPADRRYARDLLEGPKELINKYVHFTNTESDEERIVLVNLALYLEALTRKSFLNKNIPNELEYRVKLLSEDQYAELHAEEKIDESQALSKEDFLKLIEEYGG